MKLSLIILLLTGVAATTHNLRGEPEEMMALEETYGQAIRELGRNDDKTKKPKKPKEQQGGGGQGSAPVGCNPPCDPDMKCNSSNECVCKDRHATGDDCHCKTNYEKRGGSCKRIEVGCNPPCDPDMKCNSSNECVCKDRHATGDDCHCKTNYEKRGGSCKRIEGNVECTKDSECQGALKKCNRNNNECVCKKNAEPKSGDDCKCKPDFIKYDDECVECIQDSDCLGELNKCNISKKKCEKVTRDDSECDDDDDCEDKERCNKKNKCECKKGFRRTSKHKCKRKSRRERCQKNGDCDHKEICVRIFHNSRRKRCVNKSWRRKYYRCYDKDDCHNHGSCRRSYRYGYRTCHCDKHYAGRSCNRCGWRWGGYKCRRRKYYKKKYYHRRYDCDTKLKLVAVVANDENELDECIENLRFDPDLNDFLEEEFEAERLGDLEVLEVDPCTVDKLKAGLNDLVEEQDITDPTVRVVFVVLNEDTFTNGSCDEDKLDNIQYKLEEMLTCNEIRRLQDFLTIEVDDDSTQCKANELKDAVLQEDYYWREE